MRRHRCLSRPCARGRGGTGWVTASDTICWGGGGLSGALASPAPPPPHIRNIFLQQK